MKVPLLDISPQHDPIRGELIDALTEVLDSGQYILGKKVEELEEKIAKYCGTNFGIAVTSGTDALLVSLMALDVKQGDLVITTPYSFFATAGVIARLGATPVFVDIDPKTYNLDPKKLFQWFEENREKKVKAIIPVHLYGQSCDMDPILTLAKERGIYVVEDGAQSIGASYPSKDGVKVTCSMGDLGCLSFFPSKNLGALGDGGMVVTNDPKLAERVKLLRTHGAKPKYYHSLIGGNFRLAPLQAAALLVKLPHLDLWHQKRRENAEYYDQYLKGPYLAYGRDHHIYNQYVLRVPEKRDELRAFLTERKIGNEVYYPVPFHLQECFKYLGHSKGDYPESELAAKETLAIPIYPGITREMQDYVISALGEFNENLCSRSGTLG